MQKIAFFIYSAAAAEPNWISQLSITAFWRKFHDLQLCFYAFWSILRFFTSNMIKCVGNRAFTASFQLSTFILQIATKNLRCCTYYTLWRSTTLWSCILIGSVVFGDYNERMRRKEGSFAYILLSTLMWKLLQEICNAAHTAFTTRNFHVI